MAQVRLCPPHPEATTPRAYTSRTPRQQGGPSAGRLPPASTPILSPGRGRRAGSGPAAAAAVPGGGSPRRKSRARCAAFARRKARPRGNRPRPRRPNRSGSSRGWSLVRTTRFIASPRWTRLRSLRGRLTRCSAAAPRSWRSRQGVPRRAPRRVPTQLCTNRNQRRRRRRRGAPRRRRRSPRIPHPPRRRPRMKTGNPASTMKSPRSSQSRARGYRGYRPRYQPSRSSMHR